MHRFERLIKAILLTVISIILLFSAVFAYLIVTPLGGKLLVRYFKQEFSSIGLMHIGQYEGSLQDGFVLKNVTIKGLPYFPDAILFIQEIKAHIPLWNLPLSDFGIFNARLLRPGSDPIVFTGKVYGGIIKGNLYANSVDLHTATRFWLGEDIRKNLQGYISNVDLQIQGPISFPKVDGFFLAENIRYKSIFLTDGLSHVDVTLFPALNQFQIIGEIILNSGLVNVRNKNLQLNRSRFIFQGDILNPRLDISLGAKVEDMNINLVINGLVSNPQMRVSSDPPMDPQDALQVLFTGNALSSSTSPFNGLTSNDLAHDFLDYSVSDNTEKQQIGLKTKLTDNLKLGAEMDQMPSPPGETSIYYSRKINGELDVSDHTSLNVSREILPQDSYPSYEDAQPEADTQIYVQYKKRF